MQNKVQKHYQNFDDQEDIPRGVPVGQPYVGQQVPNQHLQVPSNNPQYYYDGHQDQFNNQQARSQPQQGYNYPPPPPPVALQIQPNYNYSLNMTCSCCKSNMNTIVSHQYGNTAIMWSALICCCFGQCCCVPFLWDNCLDKSHYCPNCGHNVLRKHQRCLDFIN